MSALEPYRITAFNEYADENGEGFNAIQVTVFDRNGKELWWERLFDFWYSGTKREYMGHLIDLMGLSGRDVIADEAGSALTKEN